MYVCLSARLLKKLRTETDEIFGGVRSGPKNNRLEFGGNPDHDPDPGTLDIQEFLKDFYLQSRFLYTARIKHGQKAAATKHSKPEVTVNTLNQNCQVSTAKITLSLSYKFWQTTRWTQSLAFFLLTHTNS